MDAFYSEQVGKYFVVRTYSHTNHRELWRVLTRPMFDLLSADVEATCAQREAPKGQEVFIVKVVTETDAELSENKKLKDSWHKGYEAALRAVQEGRIGPGKIEWPKPRK